MYTSIWLIENIICVFFGVCVHVRVWENSMLFRYNLCIYMCYMKGTQCTQTLRLAVSYRPS
jgi:hypothetical protein